MSDERILAPALECFARRGFDGASLSEIARNAGVTQPLLNYHYGTKEKLWRAAIEFAFRDFELRFRQAASELKELDPVDRGKVLLRRFVHFVAAHPEMMSIWFSEFSNQGPRLSWLIERYIGPFTALAQETIEEGQNAGRIKPIPGEHLQAIMIGAVGVFLAARPVLTQLADVDPRKPEVVEAHADAVIDVLVSGIVLPESDGKD